MTNTANRAEFPLQWLGECLIHQSILYEGNPDSTNLRERFVYKFEDPKLQEQSAPAHTSAPTVSNEPENPEVIMNEVSPAHIENAPATTESTIVPESTTGALPVVNGVKEEGEAGNVTTARDNDTEMGGIS